jgi:hypothetical protein
MELKTIKELLVNRIESLTLEIVDLDKKGNIALGTIQRKELDMYSSIHQLLENLGTVPVVSNPKPITIPLSEYEAQTNCTRVERAESLFLSILPKFSNSHDGIQTWLLNYGTGTLSEELRAMRGVEWDDLTQSAKTVK